MAFERCKGGKWPCYTDTEVKVDSRRDRGRGFLREGLVAGGRTRRGTYGSRAGGKKPPCGEGKEGERGSGPH